MKENTLENWINNSLDVKDKNVDSFKDDSKNIIASTEPDLNYSFARIKTGKIVAQILTSREALVDIRTNNKLKEFIDEIMKKLNDPGKYIAISVDTRFEITKVDD